MSVLYLHETERWKAESNVYTVNVKMTLGHNYGKIILFIDWGTTTVWYILLNLMTLVYVTMLSGHLAPGRARQSSDRTLEEHWLIYN